MLQKIKDSEKFEYAVEFGKGILLGAAIVVASAIIVNGTVATYDTFRGSINSEYKPKFYAQVEQE